MDRAVHGTTRARGGSRTALASGISGSTAAVAAHRPHRRRPHKRNGAEARLPPPRFAREARPMQRILVVEDDMEIARTLRDYLEVAGFGVTLVGDGSAALASARGDKPDLIVLDLGLPSLDGLDVARELRRTSTVPIVMLTARGEEADRIVGLELGADDYLVKPFSPKELVARVRAVLRRATGAVAGAEVLRAVDVEVDLPKMRARVDGRPVDLTPTEFELLSTMVREPGRVFTRGQLLDALRGVTLDTYERAIDAHVKNLRKKIEPEPGRPRYVLTVHGVGYRFADA